jgi:membrane-bound serine protease (ClpP class)
MRIRRRFHSSLCFVAVLVLGTGATALAQTAPAPSGRTAVLLDVQDAIGPATSDYIVGGLEHAAKTNAALVVLRLNTPGGLSSAMRDIIQAILDSPVPVVTFVAPQGARAASAGTYILYASHVAAMAPATNTGAATPVSIGGPSLPSLPGGGDESPGNDGDGGSAPEGAEKSAPVPATAEERKAVNDAVAYIRSLAEKRGRNAEWAERAVRSGASITAQAALENRVIDLIADDVPDLLEKLDGRVVSLPAGPVTLSTKNLVVETYEPNWRTRLLAVLTNPTVAYILMLLGIYGLIFEGYNPGAFLPGVVGAISLLLALFAFQILPVNYAGLALILLGVILIIAEFMVPSFGALGIGGIAAFVLGSVILIDTDVPGFGVPLPLITGIATTAAAALLGLIWLAMRARARPVVTGVEEMAGVEAQALEDFEREGSVFAHGERWRARATVPVKKGQTLRITRMSGLLLHVEPVEEHQQ